MVNFKYLKQKATKVIFYFLPKLKIKLAKNVVLSQRFKKLKFRFRNFQNVKSNFNVHFKPLIAYYFKYKK